MIPDDQLLPCIQLAKKIVEAREVYRTLDEQTTLAHEKYKELEMQLIQLMDANGMQKFSVEGIGTLFKAFHHHAKILDLEKAMAYFDHQGNTEELFKLAPIRERLNEYIKTLVRDGGEVPPGIEYSVAPTLNIRKES